MYGRRTVASSIASSAVGILVNVVMSIFEASMGKFTRVNKFDRI